MAYDFLDAHSSIKSASASTIGGIERPVVNIGSVVSINPASVSGTVGASLIGLAPVTLGATNPSVSGTVGASILGLPGVTVVTGSIVSGHGSVNGAASVEVLAAPGAGLRNYVTDIELANTGSADTLVDITDGDASILARTIAPSGGGSNSNRATPIKGTVNQVVNISAATATSVLYGTLTGYTDE